MPLQTSLSNYTTSPSALHLPLAATCRLTSSRVVILGFGQLAAEVGMLLAHGAQRDECMLIAVLMTS